MRALVTQWLIQPDQLYLVFSQQNKVHSLASNPLIIRLLRVMFKQRQSVPRYTMTYDVGEMLQYISNLYSKISLEYHLK